MTGSDYSWVASAASIGWIVTAYGAAYVCQKVPLARLVSSFAVLWGALCMLQAATKDFGGMFAIRIILGAAESVIPLAWVLLTSVLWTAEETPLRTALWISANGIASAIGALLSWGVGHANSGIASWKLVFLVCAVQD